MPGSEGGWSYNLLFSRGDIKGNIIPKDSEKVILSSGFFSDCMPAYCAYRIRYLREGKWKIADSEIGLKEFIGEIDNQYEAFLIAKINHFEIDRSGEGNGYIKANGGYQLRVMRYEMCPESKESFTMFVARNGELKNIESHGYYLQTNNCLTI